MIEKDHDIQLLHEDLTALEKWEETWQMSFNPTKCTVIRIVPRCRKNLKDPVHVPWPHT